MKKPSKIFDFSTNAFDRWLEITDYLKHLIAKNECIEVGVYKKTRTNQQNRAMFLYFKLVSEALNNEGHTYTSRTGIDLRFTEFKIESVWRETMFELYGIESTTKQTNEMINAIYDSINLWISIEYGIHVPFPSWQAFLNKIDCLDGKN